MNNYLDSYYKWMETEEMPDDGLCNCFISNESLELFKPNQEQVNRLRDEELSELYWGSGLHYNHPDRYSRFTELRQTIVLFMAAMNNEL